MRGVGRARALRRSSSAPSPTATSPGRSTRRCWRCSREGVAASRGRSGVHLHRDRVNQRLQGAARGAHHRADQRRRHSGHLHLRRDRRARGQGGRHAGRGLRGGVLRRGTSSCWAPRRGGFSASIGGSGAGGGRARRAAHRALLARRGPGAHGRAVRRRWRRLREELLRATDAARLPGAASCGVPPPAADALLGYLRLGATMLGGGAHAARRWWPSASSTRRAACSSSSTRPSAAASTAPGAWRCASASAAPSTSSCRRRPPRTASCCRWASSTRFPLADIFDFLRPENVEEVLVQAVLQAPLFGTRFRWNATRSLALHRFCGRQAGGAQPPARAQRGPARRGLPRAGGLPGQPRRRGRRAAGPPAGEADDGGLPARGHGRGRPARGAARHARTAASRWRRATCPSPASSRTR